MPRCGRPPQDRSCTSHLDATGVHALKDLTGSLQDEGITFLVARLKGPMRRTFREVGLLEVIGESHVYPTVRAAVRAACSEREEA